MSQRRESENRASPAVIGGFIEEAKARTRGSFTFSSKALRDGVARGVRAAAFHVRRSSMRNLQLHPEYVDDVPDGQTGFGNADYRTLWGVLYEVDWHEPNTDRNCRSCVVPGAW